MQGFKIKEIYGEGYERWAKVKECVSEEIIKVHFIEYDEYLENCSNSIKRKKDDILNGKLKIDLVAQYKIVNDNKYGFIQPITITQSSNITAIGIVKEVNDSDNIICSIQGLGDDILIEFEDDIEIGVGARIEIQGSLELDLDTCDFEKSNINQTN